MTSDNGRILSLKCKNSASGPVSPLSALKLSGQPANNRQNREQSIKNVDKIPKIRRNETIYEEDTQEDKLITSVRKSPDDFGFDIAFDDDVVLNEKQTDNAHNKEKIKKAGELALIFLDTRKTLMADQNIVDPMSNPSNFDRSREYVHNNQESISGENTHKTARSTIIRAEIVKSMIGLTYLCIQKSYDWSVYNAERNMHPGVEGVYNPLQVIRNRRIRAKYHEYPKLLTVKTLPLASNVFSSKNKSRDSKRQWKMIWALELNELISDLSWRQLHWNELKKSNGELWFPPSTDASICTSKLNDSRNHRRKLHDKLFAEEEEEDETIKENNGKQNNNLLTTSTETDDELKNYTTSGNSHYKRHKMKEKIKKHSKGFYYSSPSSSQSSSLAKDTNQDDVQNRHSGDRQIGHPHDSLASTLKNSRGGSLIYALSENGMESNHEINEESNRDHRNSQSLTTPRIKVDDNYLNHESAILSLQIKHAEHKRNANYETKQMDQFKDEQKESIEEVENIEEVDDLYALEQEHANQEIIEINSNLNYLNAAHIIRLNYLNNIHPAIMKSIELKLNRIVNKQLAEITQLSVNIDENYISTYEMFYSGFLNEIKSLVHLINDDYSIKIDYLLSNSDRSIGEINTSLSLELRKANEKLDKLNSSLFGNIVTETLRDSDLSMSFTEGGDYKMLYLFLENIIVILLRIIWVIANIYRFFRMIMKFIFKIIWHIVTFFTPNA